MKKNILLIATIAAAAVLAGCASKGPQPTSYDFGPMGAPLAPASLAPSAAGTDGRLPAWRPAQQAPTA